jgi:hypothetical protein
MSDPVRMQGEALKSSGARSMIGAVVLIVIGIAVTAITYRNADPGGSYIFAWGPIIIGGLTFFGGLFRYVRGSSVLRRAGAFPAASPMPGAGLPAAPQPAWAPPPPPPPAWTPPAAPPPQWSPPAAPPPSWTPPPAPPPPYGPPPPSGMPPPPSTPPERAV